MKSTHAVFAAAASAAISVGLAVSLSPGVASDTRPTALEALGAQLFVDPDLSWNRTQSCATCHDPDRGFIDPRDNAAGGAVSLGDDGLSLGSRNTPTVTYATFTPPFHKGANGDYFGGQFRDGRASDLEEQAGQPLLNPVEMGMPDEAHVVARLKGKAETAAAFRATFGDDIFEDEKRSFAALEKALAAFERGLAVSPFDSKYDRSLRGEYKMTDQEELGRVLFFSNQFTNCHLCHKSSATGGSASETFTNSSFNNIGVPANPALATAEDHGLGARESALGGGHDGQFRTPGLRNVAITGPYMHNGVFKDLRTVILFYDKYNSKSVRRQVNPETGRPWDASDIPADIARKELEFGPGLDDRRIDALVAFLKTLTDRRYEQLLDK
ncbi:cytochrome-c peroxidase [Kaistia terrae]|uniref:Cytochrome-c peroxidase n=1 Tax=Kaistia terrae TaxID=537017 RepID=A0ABW0PZG6_9HYPH|nr:cytochrome c peroxidase [Kaistia terrae]MCX5581649.1 methylamine utilization protein MauG [Kaistia terrae]